MKLLINYLFVLLYYSIGLIISLKYVFLYCLDLCRGKQLTISPESDEENKKEEKSFQFDFHEEKLKINDQDVLVNFVTAGSPKSPLMLFLHGFPEFWYIWKYQMLEFSQEYWTVALDIRTSNKKIADREFLVECVKVMLDHLGRNRCVLMGRDFGGSLVWSFLDKYPDLVAKSIIINAPHPAVLKHELKSVAQVVKTSQSMFHLIPRLPEWSLSRNNFQALEALYKEAEISPEEMRRVKHHFSNQNFENVRYGLNLIRSNLIADTIFRLHSKTSTSESYPQVLVVYTKANPYYKDSCFAHNHVKQALQVTEIQTKHGHYFQLNERSSTLLNKLIRDYFENPSKWETDWNEEDKTTSGNILRENFDDEGEGDAVDKLLKQCNETIENLKEDISGEGDKKNE